MKKIILLTVSFIYLLIAFIVVLPECWNVWHPAGTNEFIFCFIMPPVLAAVSYKLYLLKSPVITVVSAFIFFISLLAWFGFDFFFYFFSNPHFIIKDCVKILNVLSNITGNIYENVNVFLLCILIPALFGFLLFVIQKTKINSINHKIIDKSPYS